MGRESEEGEGDGGGEGREKEERRRGRQGKGPAVWGASGAQGGQGDPTEQAGVKGACHHSEEDVSPGSGAPGGTELVELDRQTSWSE